MTTVSNNTIDASDIIAYILIEWKESVGYKRLIHEINACKDFTERHAAPLVCLLPAVRKNETSSLGMHNSFDYVQYKYSRLIQIPKQYKCIPELVLLDIS